MTTKDKVLIGGMGAMTPLVLNLLYLDIHVVLADFDPLKLLGYSIKVATLFYLGGVVAFLHRKETDAVRLFEVGMIAPAIITAMLNAHEVKNLSSSNGNNENSEVDLQVGATQGPAFLLLLSSPAWAQDSSESIKLYKPPPSYTPFQRVLRGIGIVGPEPDRSWFVNAGEYTLEKDARERARSLERRWSDGRIEIFSPSHENPYYAVTLGAYLTHNEAKHVSSKAQLKGIAATSWSYPPEWRDHEPADSPTVKLIEAHGVSYAGTSLFSAAKSNDIDSITLLLRAAIPPNIQNGANETPLHEAAKAGATSAARHLLTSGAMVDERDKDGRTPLFIAVEKGYGETVRLFLEMGADPGVRTDYGYIPLVQAAVHGHQDVVIDLLEHGANIDATDIDGDTPLIAAAKGRQRDIVLLLVAEGADKTISNKDGRTARGIAVQRKDARILTALAGAVDN